MAHTAQTLLTRAPDARKTQNQEKRVMIKFNQTFVALFGMLALLGVVTLVSPSSLRGQDNSGNVPPAKDVNVVNTPNVIVTNTPDNPALVAEAGTHTGRAPSEHVTLYRLGGGTLQRVSAQGVPSGEQFVVPAGKVLVVTDLSWTAAGAATNAGSAATFRILNGGQIVHLSTAIIGGNGVAGASESMTSGIVFAPGSSVTWATTTISGLDVSVHGYLAPAL